MNIFIKIITVVGTMFIGGLISNFANDWSVKLFYTGSRSSIALAGVATLISGLTVIFYEVRAISWILSF